MNTKRPVIFLGAGAHANILHECISEAVVLGFVEKPLSHHLYQLSPEMLGNDRLIEHYLPTDIHLVNGVGAASNVSVRKQIYNQFTALGYEFLSIIHPKTIISSTVKLEKSVQILAGAILQSNITVGENTVINTGAQLDHDCCIAPHVHIAPGAILCGNITVESETFIGAGATIIQGITIGQGSVIGAGACVIEDVPPDTTVVGVPARRIACEETTAIDSNTRN